MPSGRHCGDGSHYLLVNDFVIFRVVMENDLIRKPNKGEVMENDLIRKPVMMENDLIRKPKVLSDE